jgi:thioredoxin 1
MAQPKHISSPEEFQALLISTTFLIVDFHATWCGPCRAITPMYSALSSQLSVSRHLAFVKVDVDAQPQIAAQYGVTAMPTFLFFQNGRPYSGRAMIRGADAHSLKAAAEELGKLAKEAAEKARKTKEAEMKSAEKLEDTPTVSGGYSMTGRSDWKMSLD